ncbi:hypothetical protein BDR07DRAFT_902787 [Suillus spraguei]|nr:hypothetical protein BDR07DRAFT_902787 [Suillus spraguei]
MRRRLLYLVSICVFMMGIFNACRWIGSTSVFLMNVMGLLYDGGCFYHLTIARSFQQSFMSSLSTPHQYYQVQAWVLRLGSCISTA